MEQGEEIIRCLTEVNFRIDTRVGNGGWKPFDCSAIAGGVSAGDENFVASVVLWRVADVKSIQTMDGEGAALSRRLVDDNFGTGDCEWCSIKIEIAE